MKFGKSQLTPSYTRKPNFRSYESAEKHFVFACTQCAQSVTVEYDTLINGVFSRSQWKQDLGETLAAEALRFYDVGIVGKSQDGGWPSMIKIECSNCKTLFLVYAGVNEFCNGAYLVTMQGITEIIEDQTI